MEVLPKRCTILGGPNGSGKSTICGLLGIEGTLVNADLIAREINPFDPGRASLAAGRQVLSLLASLEASGAPFVYETTLSSHQSLALIRRCKQRDYAVDLVYVILDDINLNVLRVAERVRRGGHDIPEPVIRRRFESSLRGLSLAIGFIDQCLVFDNSGYSPRMIVTAERGRILKMNLDETSAVHRRVAAAIEEGLRRDAQPPLPL